MESDENGPGSLIWIGVGASVQCALLIFICPALVSISRKSRIVIFQNIDCCMFASSERELCYICSDTRMGVVFCSRCPALVTHCFLLFFFRFVCYCCTLLVQGIFLHLKICNKEISLYFWFVYILIVFQYLIMLCNNYLFLYLYLK